MNKIFMILTSIFLSGCSATMVNRPGDSGSKFAPSNEAARPGMIKYLNQGANAVIESRREDAYKQMHSACNGKYKILSEGPQSDGATITSTQYGAHISSSQYWYISFKCD